MKTVGLFEAKTRLSEICSEVAESGIGVLVTRRGKPYVQIDPLTEASSTVWERRAKYFAKHEDQDAEEFVLPARSKEKREFSLED